MMPRNKLNLIPNKDYFAAGVGLDVLLRDAFTFIIKQTMGVSCPRNTSHVNFELWLLRRRLFAGIWFDEASGGLEQALDLLVLFFLTRNDTLRHSSLLVLYRELLTQVLSLQQLVSFFNWLFTFSLCFIGAEEISYFHLWWNLILPRLLSCLGNCVGTSPACLLIVESRSSLWSVW